MNDRLSVIIGGKTITGWTGYTIEHNIYTAAAYYSVELDPRMDKTINHGDRIELKVNGETVLSGIVETKSMDGDKNFVSYRISGRDLMGLVVDEHVENFNTLRSKKMFNIVEHYLRQINFVKSADILYTDGAESLDVAQEYVQPRPGQTVFDLIGGIAASRGLHFYMRADGKIVIGKPKGYGTHKYSVWRTTDRKSNILRFGTVSDISQRYSRVVMLGQKESTPSIGASSINQKVVATDNTMPLTKTIVVETQTAAQTLQQQARMIIEQQRFDGFSIRYTLPGYSQQGYVWQPDTICSVDDHRLGIREEMLIYGRSFNLSKNDKTTEITLGRLAVAA